MVSIRSGHLSVTGNVRENNEDNCYVDPQQRLFIVADGLGGQSAGERASAMAVDIIPRRLATALDFSQHGTKLVAAALEKALVNANTEIMAVSEMEPGLRNMGTTAVMLVITGGLVYTANVGDSRAYEFRKGRLRQLTTDHSITQALLDSGTITPEEAKTHRYRNVLYRYLGCRDGSAPLQVQEIAPQSGDRFVLCSDGLNDGIPDSRIAELLASNPDPQKAAETLVQAALDGGSRDNVTCVVVDVQ
ncbi:MAG: Serine/threonine phosphatase stp [Planctomycetota bacterium]|jgi:protein phosphatase